MTELSHDGPDFIIVGWKAKPAPGIHGLFGSTHSEPVRRQLSLPEQKIIQLIRVAETVEDFDRAMAVADKYGLASQPPPPPPSDGGVQGHYARIDAWRIVITVLLVVGVVAIAAWSLLRGNAESAAQYAAPVSGLAGIGLGWLFTNDRTPTVWEVGQGTSRPLPPPATAPMSTGRGKRTD